LNGQSRPPETDFSGEDHILCGEQHLLGCVFFRPREVCIASQHSDATSNRAIVKPK